MIRIDLNLDWTDGVDNNNKGKIDKLIDVVKLIAYTQIKLIHISMR